MTEFILVNDVFNTKVICSIYSDKGRRTLYIYIYIYLIDRDLILYN